MIFSQIDEKRCPLAPNVNMPYIVWHLKFGVQQCSYLIIFLTIYTMIKALYHINVRLQCVCQNNFTLPDVLHTQFYINFLHYNRLWYHGISMLSDVHKSKCHRDLRWSTVGFTLSHVTDNSWMIDDMLSLRNTYHRLWSASLGQIYV